MTTVEKCSLKVGKKWEAAQRMSISQLAGHTWPASWSIVAFIIVDEICGVLVNLQSNLMPVNGCPETITIYLMI